MTHAFLLLRLTATAVLVYLAWQTFRRGAYIVRSGVAPGTPWNRPHHPLTGPAVFFIWFAAVTLMLAAIWL